MKNDGAIESLLSIGVAYVGALAPALAEPALQGTGVAPWHGSPSANVPRRYRREISLELFERRGGRYLEDVMLSSGHLRGPATAVLSRASLADGDTRGDISSVYPPGWHQRRVSWVVDSQGWLWNRCHLVAWCLAAGATGPAAPASSARGCGGCGVDNPQNLFTGTRYLNTKGMLPVETEVYQFLRHTSTQVAYQVTPLYRAGERIPRAVRIEARSIGRPGLAIDRVCYNVQPGYEIDYRTGKARLLV